ncbi:MAG: response regulator [Spirochaetales bacterium]|nr:response regulator [Spirochaetales bacterium]
MLQHRKILIIDDDVSLQKVLGIQLENGGYESSVAESGQRALELLAEGSYQPECILSDIKMPGLSGLDLLPLLKEQYPLVPVVMLTAHTDLETGLKAMRSGAYDYITKPVRRQTLFETIERALQYYDVEQENNKLKEENRRYQENLERNIEERTREVIDAYQALKDTNLAVVKVLAETIEAKDQYTRGHCNRVRMLSRELASHYNLSEQEIEVLEYGALLHDIGKIGIPEKLLNKCDILDKEEKAVFEDHTVIGEKILSIIEFFNPCLTIVRHHHERWDGSGYPDGLKGEEISLLSRIVQVCDSFDAMTSTRPYRGELPLDEALGELKKGRESQFDADIVDLFIAQKIYRCVL